MRARSHSVRARLFKMAVRLCGPLLLGVILYRMHNKDALIAVFRTASWGLLFLAALLNGANIHLKVMRWQWLLATRGYHYKVASAWRAILPSMYLGMITPGRVGDVLRIQYLRHDIDVPYAEGLAVIVMDRFCDLYVLLAFVAAGVAHFTNVWNVGGAAGDLGQVMWLGVVIVALLPLLFLVRGPADAVLSGLYQRIAKDSTADGPQRFLAALRAQLGGRLVFTIPLSAGAFLIQYLQGYLVARAMGLSISYVDVVCMLAITSLLSLLPISMSGIGVRELFLALAFPAIGLSAEHGIAFGLLVFLVVYVSTIAAGFVAWQLSPPPFKATAAAS